VAGVGAAADAAAVTATFTVRGDEHDRRPGNRPERRGAGGGAEQAQETAAQTLSALLAAAESIQDAGATGATATQTGAGTILLGDAGTVAAAITASGVGQTFTYLPTWGPATGEIAKVPRGRRGHRRDSRSERDTDQGYERLPRISAQRGATIGFLVAVERPDANGVPQPIDLTIAGMKLIVKASSAPTTRSRCS